MHTLFDLLQSEKEAIQLTDTLTERFAQLLSGQLGLSIYPRSITIGGQTLFALGRVGTEKRLVVVAADGSRTQHYEGERVPLNDSELHACVGPTTPSNADQLRNALPYLSPQVLGLRKSVGCGDRLGLATPGHIDAIRSVESATGKHVALIAAQQSVRENARTGRTPQQVLDEAMWGVFEAGWTEGFGADADHLKRPEDVQPWVEAGYTFYTIDPGDHVNDAAEEADGAELGRMVEALPWEVLESTPRDVMDRLTRPIDIGTEIVHMDEGQALRAMAKYGRAVAHTVSMYRHIKEAMAGRPFELEVSVDETATVTRVEEHIYIAGELKRLGVEWVSLAPRYVGAFEKGVDFIGDLSDFRREFARHTAVARTFGPYKLSLHSGSDKFSVYPIAADVAGELLHLKTAGTSYLEALRTVAVVRPRLFRQILQFAIERYETDRATYHVSGRVSNIPDPKGLTEKDLAEMVDHFDARQALHVTFGSVLKEDAFREGIFGALREHEDVHYTMVSLHFQRHLNLFV